jgi:hypothetical protein
MAVYYLHHAIPTLLLLSPFSSSSSSIFCRVIFIDSTRRFTTFHFASTTYVFRLCQQHPSTPFASFLLQLSSIWPLAVSRRKSRAFHFQLSPPSVAFTYPASCSEPSITSLSTSVALLSLLALTPCCRFRLFAFTSFWHLCCHFSLWRLAVVSISSPTRRFDTFAVTSRSDALLSFSVSSPPHRFDIFAVTSRSDACCRFDFFAFTSFRPLAVSRQSHRFQPSTFLVSRGESGKESRAFVFNFYLQSYLNCRLHLRDH